MIKFFKCFVLVWSLLQFASCVDWGSVGAEIYVINDNYDLSSDIVIYYDKNAVDNKSIETISEIQVLHPYYSNKRSNGEFYEFHFIPDKIRTEPYKQEESGSRVYWYFKSEVKNIVTAQVFAFVNGSGHDVETKNVLKVNYPKTLSVSSQTVSAGNKITITSTEPFFKVENFNPETLQFKMDNNYQMIWVSSSDEYYKNYKWYEPSSSVSDPSYPRNFEKVPVPISNYDMDSITPYSITFTIPSFMRTGTIHVVNELGIYGLYWSGYDFISHAFFTTADEVLVK